MEHLLGLTQEEIEKKLPASKKIDFIYTGPPKEDCLASLRAIRVRLKQNSLEILLTCPIELDLSSTPSR